MSVVAREVTERDKSVRELKGENKKAIGLLTR